MQRVLLVMRKFTALPLFLSSLLFATGVAAEDDWEFDLEAYGWLPIVETQTETGQKAEITRDQLLDDLDKVATWAGRVRKGKWSLTSDFVYFKISEKPDLPLVPEVPSLARLREAGMQAWIITPSIGYTVFDNDKQKIELYAGARYTWIGIDATIDINPTGEPSNSMKESPSVSYWDGIVGVRGSYSLSDKWFIPYSINVGTGQTDLTWQAQGGFGYRFKSLDAVLGWRDLSYDIGSGTPLKELDVNGPFAGAIFHW
jgi:hypothetical protein